MAAYEEIAVGSDHYIVQPVQDNYTLADIDDATVMAQLKNLAGAAVGGAISCAYQSNGEYLGTLPASVTVGLAVGTRYKICVTVSGTANDYREVPCKAVTRGKV